MGRMMDFEDLKQAVTADWQAQQAWREDAEEDYAFVAGHQWTDAEKAAMEESNRAAIVFNRTSVILSSVAGSEVNNRTEVRFIPREIGDAKQNEVLTAGAEWFRDLANAEDNESQAFEDMLVCGIGWTETSLDFEEDDEGAPVVDRIDPLEMCWDASARKKGLTDARRFARVRPMDAAEAKSRFPDHEPEEIDCAWIRQQGADEVIINNPGDEYDTDEEGMNGPLDALTVVQVQVRERKRVVEFLDAMGQRQEMPKDRWDRISKTMDVVPPHRTKSAWVWTQYFLGAHGILETNQPDERASTFCPITGLWDRKDKQFYGLLRSMKDPQKYANKWLSQTLHIINSNAKGGVLYEAGAVDDVRDFEDSWAAADAATQVKNGALSQGMIQPKPQVQMPSALMQLTDFAISAIRDASGVNMELLGLRDQNQPGVLEYQRKQAAMTTLAKFFDSLRFYRKRHGQVLLDFLRDYIAPTGRLVRIVKEGEAQYVPLAMEMTTQKYDVIVDDAPSAPNEKEKAWSVIEAMMPMLQQAGLSMDDWADIIEYSPLPTSFVDKVREKAEQQRKQAQDPAQQAMQQLALQDAQAELQKKQTEAAENMAQARNYAAQAQERMVESQLKPAQVFADLYQPMQAPRGGVQ